MLRPLTGYDIMGAHAVICVSIVCGLIVLCMLRRLIQHYYPNALLIYPVAPRMARRQPSEGACNLCLTVCQQSITPPCLERNCGTQRAELGEMRLMEHRMLLSFLGRPCCTCV